MGRITLTCWALNLSISEAIPVWFQDEKPVQQKTFGSKTILPSGDGTYQAWVSTWALPRQEPQFTCNLKHGGYNINISAVPGEETQTYTRRLPLAKDNAQRKRVIPGEEISCFPQEPTLLAVDRWSERLIQKSWHWVHRRPGSHGSPATTKGSLPGFA